MSPLERVLPPDTIHEGDRRRLFHRRLDQLHMRQDIVRVVLVDHLYPRPIQLPSGSSPTRLEITIGPSSSRTATLLYGAGWSSK